MKGRIAFSLAFIMKYDYLIVGAGLFGAVFAHEAKEAGKSVLMVDKRDHSAGNKCRNVQVIGKQKEPLAGVAFPCISFSPKGAWLPRN